MIKKKLIDIVNKAVVAAGILAITAGTATAQNSDRGNEHNSRSTYSSQNGEENEEPINGWTATYTFGKSLRDDNRLLSNVPGGAFDLVDSNGVPLLVPGGSTFSQMDLEWSAPNTKLELRGILAEAYEPNRRAVFSEGTRQIIDTAVSANVGLLQKIKPTADGKSLYVGGDIGLDPLSNIVANVEIGFMDGNFGSRYWSIGGGVRSVNSTYATSNDIIRGNNSQIIFTEDYLSRSLVTFVGIDYSHRTRQGDLSAGISLEFPDEFLYTKGETASGRETRINYSRSHVLEFGWGMLFKIPGLPIKAGGDLYAQVGRLTPLDESGTRTRLYEPITLINSTASFIVRISN
jgi:hypothetical protein